MIQKKLLQRHNHTPSESILIHGTPFYLSQLKLDRLELPAAVHCYIQQNLIEKKKHIRMMIAK